MASTELELEEKYMNGKKLIVLWYKIENLRRDGPCQEAYDAKAWSGQMCFARDCRTRPLRPSLPTFSIYTESFRQLYILQGLALLVRDFDLMPISNAAS